MTIPKIEARNGTPPQPGIYEPTAREMGEDGYELGPDQTVAFAIYSNPAMEKVEMEIGDGLTVKGKPVAEVRVGGDKESSNGTVLETDAEDNLDNPSKEYSIIFDGTTDNKPILKRLMSGRMVQIGRGQEWQGTLPRTVSRDHCAVGIDGNGRLVVDNRHPKNYTTIRRLGTFTPIQ